MSIESIGSRLYVTGNTYGIKDRLKAIGCHWDADRKQWWIGKAKQAELAAIVSTVAAQTTANGYVKPTADELSSKPCSGKVEYKGKTYYVVGQSDRTGKLHLTVLDCSIEFWADSSACNWVKRYQARTQFQGYSRGNVEVAQTVGSIRRFIEQSRRDETAIKSGQIPAGYCVDLEDGCLKRRSECDMPSN